MGAQPYRYLDDVALADIAFEAEGETLASLFEACALATTEVMADPATIEPTQVRRIALEAETLEALLYDWLAEIIWLKDAEGLLFSRFAVALEGAEAPRLAATLWGEPIAAGRAALRADVKAVTYHLFAIERADGGWRARVVLDV
ncbi:MAG TPA: archease [Candidatus Methylomirabilis sp.]